MNFIVYTESGDIVRTGSCPDAVHMALQAQVGEFVMEGVANADTDTVDVERRVIVKNINPQPAIDFVLPVR